MLENFTYFYKNSCFSKTFVMFEIFLAFPEILLI